MRADTRTNASKPPNTPGGTLHDMRIGIHGGPLFASSQVPRGCGTWLLIYLALALLIGWIISLLGH